MTIRLIINDAFREAGIVAVGGEVAAEEFEEALRRLNSLYKSLFGYELGGPLTLTTSTDKVVNVRIINPTATTITLKSSPQDGARLSVKVNQTTTIDANGRTIEGSNTLVIPAGTNQQWFYRDDLGDWVKVQSLTAEDESPLPEEFSDLLTTLLAFRLHPRFGATTAQETVEVLKRMRSQFRARYHQTKEVPSEDGLLRLSSRLFGLWGINPHDFDEGV